ncbi:MFS monocarboxylate transporter [Purpureocillium lavendulum]|uniref:MFS monocarboxylate transporter n=1 Tax=Purpureocillium lavendulum TaxID=1247861 RepID=A0AB34FRE1_9HYPO|nr:MFS monocarboxylate transporter [Purpureocillium lavendulum]
MSSTAEIRELGELGRENGSISRGDDDGSTDTTSVEQGDSLPPTDHGRGAYLALACCTIAQAPIWGYSVSFGIFQEYYSSSSSRLDATPGAIASIGAAQMGVMYLMMPVAFLTLHRYPHLRRWGGPLGLLITVASISASAFVTSVAGLIATQGVLYALGCGLLFSPISMYMDEWFVERKGLAYGVMCGGKSAVGVAMPFVFSALLQRFGLRATLLSWAVTSAVMTLPTLVFLKPRVPLPRTYQARPLSFGFVRHAPFWMMQIGIIVQSLGYLMPSTYLASYASAIGLSSVTGPMLLALFSLASVPGAVIHGILGDKMSATKVILISSLGSALPVFLLWGLSRHLANMVVFVVLYGFFAGGFSSTWSGMLHEIKRDDAGTDTSIVFGMLLGGRGLGFVLGGPVSGALVSAGGALAGDTLGYATRYGPMILCTGVTAILGAWAPFWKMTKIAKSRWMGGMRPAHVSCEALATDRALQGRILTAEDPAYDARLQTYYSANAAQRPRCMAVPETTREVQAIARILARYGCPFGLKAGGHSAWKGSNSVADGVTIDFGYMNSTAYDPATGIASIQPGARWDSVYKALDKYNVTVVGARSSGVGVGGFTTGGGYSFHSNSHGMSCDVVENWEIVLADGSVVHANAHENADLWKAQKGASGNFGFITRIEQRVVPGRQLWGGFTSYNVAERDRLFNAYVNFVKETPEDSPDQTIALLGYDRGNFYLQSIFTNSDGLAGSSAFDEYRTIPNISSTVASGPESEIIQQFSGPTLKGLYTNWFTGMAKNCFSSLSLIEELHREYIPKMQAAAPQATLNTLITFQPVTNTMVENGLKRGGNVLGLERIVADGPAQMWLVAVTVDTADHQAAILPVARQFVAAIKERQKKQQTYIDWVYLNYAWADEKPLSYYGTENLELLRRVSRKYDPTGLFQKTRKAGFKLDDSEPEDID